YCKSLRLLKGASEPRLEGRTWKHPRRISHRSAGCTSRDRERDQGSDTRHRTKRRDQGLETLRRIEGISRFRSHCSALSRKASTHGTDRRKPHRHLREIFGG